MGPGIPLGKGGSVLFCSCLQHTLSVPTTPGYTVHFLKVVPSIDKGLVPGSIRISKSVDILSLYELAQCLYTAYAYTLACFK